MFKFPRQIKPLNQYDSHERTFIILAMLIGSSILFALPAAQDIRGLLGNIASELGGAVITYLLIDRMIGIKERQEEEDQTKTRERDRLLRQLSNPDVICATEALSRLRELNYLEDGTLKGSSATHANLRGKDLYKIDFQGADLESADLSDADLYLASMQRVNLSDANLQGIRLQRANLTSANLWTANLRQAQLNRAVLRGADLRFADLRWADLEQADLEGVALEWANLGGVKNLEDWQLTKAWALQGAIMRDGQRYDGRFNLRGDIMEAWQCETPNEAETMADFYGVSVEEYLAGQVWAKQNLKTLPRCDNLPLREKYHASRTLSKPFEPGSSNN